MKKVHLIFCLLPILLCAQQKPVIQDAKVLILKGGAAEEITENALKDKEGVMVYDLEIPGGVEKLKKALNPYFLHQEMGKDELILLKIQVEKYFFQHGRPFVKASIPEQDVSNGVIQFEIKESRLGEISTEGNRYFSSDQIKKGFRIKPGDVLREKAIADDLYFMNTSPYHKIDVVYTPGEKPNTTDMILRVTDRRTWRLYSGVDNTGIVGTARGRWFVGVNFGNVFWSDHTFDYQYTTSFDFHKFQAHTANYVAPLPWRHTLNLYGGYATVKPDNLGIVTDTETFHTTSTGRSYQASLRYNMPMYSDQFIRTESILGFDFKRTNNALFFEEIPFSIPSTPFSFTKNVNLTQLVYGFDLFCMGNRFNIEWEMDLFWSPGRWISDQTDRDYESIRPGAKNHWVYGKTRFLYEQRWPLHLLSSVRIVGQLSSQNLLPSEQLGLGGYESVRGYDERQETKDSGVLASFELRSPIVPKTGKRNWIALEVLAFVDYGWGTNHTPLPLEPKNDWMLGVGPGIRATINSYFTARFDWGFKLHKRSFYTGGSSQGYFALIGAY